MISSSPTLAEKVISSVMIKSLHYGAAKQQSGKVAE